MKKHLLLEMNWKEAEEAFNRWNMAIIPLGSLHPHGLNCPIGIEHIMTTEFADRLGKRTGVPVLPTQIYGYLIYHGSFPGTIGLKPSTYSDMLIQICGWLHKWNVKKVVFSNFHGGNKGAIRHAADYIRARWNMMGALYVSAPQTPLEKKSEWAISHSRDKYSTVGAEGLTTDVSTMLYLRPDLVDPTKETYKKRKQTFGPNYELMDMHVVMFKGGRVNMFLRSEDISDTDGWGIPKDEVNWETASSAELGEAMFNKRLEYMIEFIEEFKKIKIPPLPKYEQTGIDYPY